MRGKTSKRKERFCRVHIRQRISTDGKRWSLQLEYTANDGERVREGLRLKVLTPLGMKTATQQEKEQSRENWEVAEIIRSRTESELIHGLHKVSTKRAKQQQFIPYFDKIASTKRHSTREGYRKTRGLLIDYAGEFVTFKDIDEEWVRGYVSYLDTKPTRNNRRYKQNSKAMYFKSIKHVLRCAVRDGIISKNPAQYISVSGELVEREYLTAEELSRLESYEANTDKQKEVLRAFLFACYCGLRVSDVERLTWESIEETTIQGERIHLLKYRQQKTQKQCYLPLSNKAINIIGKRGKGLVFDIITIKEKNTKLKIIAKGAGISKNIHFHTARHTFAVLSLQKGVDIYSLSNMLGHSDLKTTQIYAKMSDEKIRQAVAILNKEE